MRLAIFGSRTLTGPAAIQAVIDGIIRNQPTAIVTAGEPAGVCSVAQEAARLYCIPLTLHWLDKKHRCAGAWHHRSKNVLRDCEAVLIVHDGKSKGTANEKTLAEKMGVRVDYVICEANHE